MNLTNYHAGHNKQQLEYKSFKPSSIHHAWVIADSEVQTLLGKADRAIGELNAFASLVPNIDFFIKTYVAKEATHSSRIEGTQTNIEDVFKESQDISPEKRDDWNEVQNYIAAITYAIERLNSLPLSNRLLCEAHGILMRGVRGENKRPGEFRLSQNWIGVSLKNAVFVPPHADHVIEFMSDLEKFLHDENFNVPPLIKIAIAHYQFVTIHPFLDGNGRLGRLMISLFLTSEQLLAKPALYLSHYFEKHKVAYIDHLMAVRQGHHMREWLVFFLFGVEETARAAINVFKDILSLKMQIERDVLPRFSVRRLDNANKIIQQLYQKPIIDVNEVVQLLNTTPSTAGALIQDLVTHGVLHEVTGYKRNRTFIFVNYLELFK